VLGQLAEKINRRPKTCVAIATFLWLGVAAHVAARTYVDYALKESLNAGATAMALKVFGVVTPSNVFGVVTPAGVLSPALFGQKFTFLCLLSLVGAIVSTLLVFATRRYIRHRDGIAPTTSRCCFDAFDDLLCSVCCSTCVTCQVCTGHSLPLVCISL
jgi:hypothetical protein